MKNVFSEIGIRKQKKCCISIWRYLETREGNAWRDKIMSWAATFCKVIRSIRGQLRLLLLLYLSNSWLCKKKKKKRECNDQLLLKVPPFHHSMDKQALVYWFYVIQYLRLLFSLGHLQSALPSGMQPKDKMCYVQIPLLWFISCDPN